ncbi:hypothetical protein [Gordonia soli]|nr:hypothetical protein [Gordonia soli]
MTGSSFPAELALGGFDELSVPHAVTTPTATAMVAASHLRDRRRRR